MENYNSESIRVINEIDVFNVRWIIIIFVMIHIYVRLFINAHHKNKTKYNTKQN